ncbi:MAG TPA: GNAT family N-acetyltransferase [Acidimicrobiales bacterium]|nr:GNAT family N-acetyltransferase [Acidimicrobiales bacterium]
MQTTLRSRCELRDATEADVEFVAWVMLAASRSHLPRGIWEYLYDFSEEQALEFLRGVTVTDTVHLFHHSLFLIAEVDGEPAAAMCGYDPESQGFGAFVGDSARIASACGADLESPDFASRSEVLMSGFPAADVERPWVVENVATAPAFRRQGLVDLLLREQLARGRSRGFDVAQISVFLENEPARRAYVKAGFEVVGEARDPRFQDALGCPGAEVLLQRLA